MTRGLDRTRKRIPQLAPVWTRRRVVLVAVLMCTGVASGQIMHVRGQDVVPVFEGWEENPDGIFNAERLAVTDVPGEILRPPRLALPPISWETERHQLGRWTGSDRHNDILFSFVQIGHRRPRGCAPDVDLT